MIRPKGLPAVASCTKFATFAYSPLNCLAGSSAEAAEMTFYVGVRFG